MFALGVSAQALLATLPAAAQQSQQAQSAPDAARSYHFDIPAKPVPQAIADLSKVTGLQVLYTAEQPFAATSRPVVGHYTAADALNIMLAGSGIGWRFTGANSVTLSVTGGDSAVLPAVTAEAEARRETAWGPVGSYVATRSATGSKTDTPLIETPQSISVVTREQMQAQAVTNLGDALRYTPGVTGELFGNDTRGYGMQIRGFNMWDQAFYKDGLQLRASSFATFLTLDPYGAERLELMRGPVSVLYGQNDPGGIINYVSKRPTDEPLYEVGLGLGDPSRLDGKFDFSGPVNEERTVLYRVTGLARDSETHVDYVDQDRLFFAPALTWRPDADTSLTLLAHYQRDETGWGIQFLPAAGTIYPNPNGQIPINRFTGEPDFDQYDLTQYSLGYELEHRIDETWSLRQNARYAHLENEQKGVFGLGFLVVNPGNPADPANFRQLDRYGDYGEASLDSYTIDNRVQAEFGTGPLTHKALFGLDLQSHKFSDKGGESNPLSPIDIFNPVYGEAVIPGALYQETRISQDQIGLYLQDQIKFGKLALTLGARQDWLNTDTDDRLNGTASKQKDNAMTGRAGLVYLSETGFAPYLSYSEAFLPSLGTDAAGQTFVPEMGQQYEAGVKYQPPGWDSFLTLAAFDLTRQNVRTADPDNPAFEVQTGEVKSRGIELEAVASLTDALNLRGAYTFQNVEITKNNDGNEGNTPYGVPEHRAALWADYTMRRGDLAGLGFGAGVRYIGTTFGDDANTFKTPAVTLFDAAVHYDIHGYRFSVNASNLFDKDYVASCSGTSYCYYGPGRTVLASVTYNW